MGEYQYKPFSFEEPWLSKSSINLYNFCPHAFYLRYIKGCKGQPSRQMKRGTEFHDWAEEIYEKVDKDKLINKETTITKEYKENLPEDADIRTKKDVDLYKNFIEIEDERWKSTDKKKNFFPVKTENFLTDEELLYHGSFDRLDLFDENEDTYVVIEYKTGDYKDYKMSGYRFELFGYKHLIEHNYDYDVTHMCVIFPDSKHFVLEKFKKATKRAFYKKVKRTRKRILNREFDKKGYCEYCFMDVHCDRGN